MMTQQDTYTNITLESVMTELELATAEWKSAAVENCQLKEKVSALEAQLDWFKRQIFGKKSERVVTSSNETYLPGFGLETGKQQELVKKVAAARARRIPVRSGKDAISFSDDIPKERIVIDIPAEE